MWTLHRRERYPGIMEKKHLVEVVFLSVKSKGSFPKKLIIKEGGGGGRGNPAIDKYPMQGEQEYS